MKVEWSAPAEADLDRITAYVAAQSVASALRLQDRLVSAAADLAILSERGRRGRITGTRERVLSGTPYILVYEVEDGVVSVLHVFHGARDWP